jgi:cell shape-determining protein MreD
VNHLNSFAIIVIAYFAVFIASYPHGPRNWLGAQVDLLPVVMVYCGLTAGLGMLTLTAVLGGLWFDSLSANLLGAAVLPLFLTGLAVHQTRELILRDQIFARFLLGTIACAFVPFMTALILWACGEKPLIGFGSLWQWLIMAAGGGILTPFCFWFFDHLNEVFAYKRPAEMPFRPDREIKRGRV